jgi:integrase
VAVLNQARFEFDAHVPHARAAGVSQEKIDAVSEPVPGPCFTPPEQQVLALTDAMTRDIVVPDALMTELQARYSPQQLVDLVATVAAYKGATTKFLAWLGAEADAEIHRVSKQHVRRFRDHVAGELHPNTANQIVRNLRVFFNAAKADGYVDSVPCDGLKSLKKPTERTRRGFTVEELRVVIKEAKGTEWASMVIFGLYTGQRLGDLARLKWTSIDLEEGVVRLTTGKTGTVVIVPMCKPLEDHVLSLPAGDKPDAYVHPELGALAEFSNGGPHLSRQFGDLLARCGFRELNTNHAKIEGRTSKLRAVKALSFHSLRHSAVSMMKNAGIPAVVVQDIVGHASEAVSQVYTKIETETKRNALAKLPTI